jgi:hypothetical protein
MNGFRLRLRAVTKWTIQFGRGGRIMRWDKSAVGIASGRSRKHKGKLDHPRAMRPGVAIADFQVAANVGRRERKDRCVVARAG